MALIHRAVLIFIFMFWSIGYDVFAQENRSNIVGGIQVGSISFNSISPTANAFKLNSGTFFALHGIKAMGIPGFYLVGAAQYIKSTGTLNYNYTGNAGAVYQASGVTFNFDNFNVLLGTRIKILERSILRPFFEGAVTGGYSQVLYDSNLRTAAVVAAGSDYKTTDTTLDFGLAFSGGLEIQMTPLLNLEIFVRYLRNSTRALPTLNNQAPIYEGQGYGAGLNMRF